MPRLLVVLYEKGRFSVPGLEYQKNTLDRSTYYGSERGDQPMSMPNIPDITPEIDMTRDEAVTLLLASIAMEEMGLAHILNAEGEKMQYVLKLQSKKTINVNEVLAVNESIERVIQSITRLQIILQDKLDHVVRIIPPCPHPGPCPRPPHPGPCPGPPHPGPCPGPPHPGPCPRPPHPGPCCMLIGCALGCINNPDDDFYRANATLDANNKGDCEGCPLKYTLYKAGKGCSLSAVLVPIRTGLEVHCPRISSCPRPDNPSILIMQGRAVMSIQGLGEGAHKATVNFRLTVWDYGIRREFQMITRSQNEMFNHDSGVVVVNQGNLKIKSLESGRVEDCD